MKKKNVSKEVNDGLEYEGDGGRSRRYAQLRRRKVLF